MGEKQRDPFPSLVPIRGYPWLDRPPWAPLRTALPLRSVAASRPRAALAHVIGLGESERAENGVCDPEVLGLIVLSFPSPFDTNLLPTRHPFCLLIPLFMESSFFFSVCSDLERMIETCLLLAKAGCNAWPSAEPGLARKQTPGHVWGTSLLAHRERHTLWGKGEHVFPTVEAWNLHRPPKFFSLETRSSKQCCVVGVSVGDANVALSGSKGHLAGVGGGGTRTRSDAKLGLSVTTDKPRTSHGDH